MGNLTSGSGTSSCWCTQRSKQKTWFEKLQCRDYHREKIVAENSLARITALQYSKVEGEVHVMIQRTNGYGLVLWCNVGIRSARATCKAFVCKHNYNNNERNDINIIELWI